jgi:hypothetical protein
MPDRVADRIEELARPSKDEKSEEPQPKADPALRRARFLHRTPAWAVAALAFAAGVAAGSSPGIPRCITPRPWPPSLTGWQRGSIEADENPS